jgi:hypothetical protein
MRLDRREVIDFSLWLSGLSTLNSKLALGCHAQKGVSELIVAPGALAEGAPRITVTVHLIREIIPRTVTAIDTPPAAQIRRSQDLP